MSALKEILNFFRQKSIVKTQYGTNFERLCIDYLKNEPSYKSQFKDVLTYGDWISQYGSEIEQKHKQSLTKQDIGIDLVAVNKDENFVAIQCKFYEENNQIGKKDIDSFLAASGTAYFTRRILITTTSKIDKNASKTIEMQKIPLQVINLYDLENSQFDWDFYFENIKNGSSQSRLKDKKQLRDYQKEAVEKVKQGLKNADRGKMIMACGTGKTFTALKIAEEIAGNGGVVLFLVPSLSLLDQTIKEWQQNSALQLNLWAVCSDSNVGKKKSNEDDLAINSITELVYPATTDAKQLTISFNKEHSNSAMSVIFSTYHSLEVIKKAQENSAFAEFDLIICDEAHRTTGYAWEGEEVSIFSKITEESFIKGKKRLFMTATPRVYSNEAKKKQKEGEVELFSMDDEEKYGKDFYVLPFSKAVAKNLLVDYKVIIFSIKEEEVSRLPDYDYENSELSVSDMAKIVGCWKAITKQNLMDSDETDNSSIMKRSVAFCTVIDSSKSKAKEVVGSTQIEKSFSEIVEIYRQAIESKYQEQRMEVPAKNAVKCEVKHIDGSMGAWDKKDKIQWLKDEPEPNSSKILSNVRCLTEGVDVPALDAIMFLTPKSSKVDIVQAVGRVMRRAEGKKRGYVILPVVIPSNTDPQKALDDNKNYKIVWEVLNALRSHDDKFDAILNRIDLMKYGELPPNDKIEVISIAELNKALPNSGGDIGGGKKRRGRDKGVIGKPEKSIQPDMFGYGDEIGEIEEAIYARIVKKCGNSKQWEEWAEEVSVIAEKHISSIKKTLDNPANTEQISAFSAFADNLKNDLNKSLTNDEIVQMLAQHIITEPVFSALFAGSPFVENNPVSKAIKPVLEVLSVATDIKDKQELEHFYSRVKLKIQGLQTLAAKQALIKDLYDNFFNKAFSKMAEKLGIVYTPVEVVDFIIHSVEYVMNKEFSSSLKENGVHILDPFTGTGTFITRLLQSGIIPLEKIEHKYSNEIHANEIVPLAYYIAAVNIESVFHDLIKNNINQEYKPFNGICLTDTFETHEDKSEFKNFGANLDNSDRISRQKKQEIRVIMGNPPYSAGQDSANDNNQNNAYPILDKRIEESYVANTTATNKNSLYDSYIRAIRWASDRIEDKGVIGFITNGGFVDSNSADGLRKCLNEEFSSIYIFHLRGNQRTQGERSRKEGGKIFGSGSRAPIAISILVKNPEKQESKGKIYFHDIGDYLTREEKLQIIADFHDIKGIKENSGFIEIIPDKFNDWINQRDPNFDNYISIGDKKGGKGVFIIYAGGVKTNRDIWAYNFSYKQLAKNMKVLIDTYNSEVQRYKNENPNVNKGNAKTFATYDETLISWDSTLERHFSYLKTEEFAKENIKTGLYRPFTKMNLYFSKFYNNTVGYIDRFFPNIIYENLGNEVFSLTGRGSTKEFSTLITDEIPDLEMISKGQVFPRYIYENIEQSRAEQSRAEQSRAEQSRAEQRGDYRANAEIQRAKSGILSSRLRLQEQRASLASSQIAYPIYTSSATVNASQCGYGNEFSNLHNRIGDNQRLFSANDRLHTRCATANERSSISAVSIRGEKMKQRDFVAEQNGELVAEKVLTKKHAISDDALNYFRQPYGEEGKEIQKDDIFYFIYGLLHSEDYRTKYADNLSKQLPRIPRPKSFADFCHFANAGLDLAELHLNYEKIPCYMAKLSGNIGQFLSITPIEIMVIPSAKELLKQKGKEIFLVEKMKFPNKPDKSVISYNRGIIIENIPLEAYDYIVNGKSAIEWVMERQAITIDKNSGISNNSNDFANETMNNPRYPLELLLRVITVSIETMKIVRNLPKLQI